MRKFCNRNYNMVVMLQWRLKWQWFSAARDFLVITFPTLRGSQLCNANFTDIWSRVWLYMYLSFIILFQHLWHPIKSECTCYFSETELLQYNQIIISPIAKILSWRLIFVLRCNVRQAIYCLTYVDLSWRPVFKNKKKPNVRTCRKNSSQ